MRRCVELARVAAAQGEVPVGAVVVRDGVALGEGHNLCETLGDATQHAELIALRAAFATVGEGRLPGAVVYCSLEPCFMCAGALSHARVARVVWAVRDPKFGGAASLGAVLVYYYGLAAVLPRFIERRSGHVAVVASVAGYRGLPTAAAYGASKAALINMAESMKPELDQYGVRISIVNPGFVRTPLTDKNDFPMPFLIEPDDAAERIVHGLARGRFEIAFPRRFVWGLKLLRCLPYALYFPLARKLITGS